MKKALAGIAAGLIAADGVMWLVRPEGYLRFLGCKSMPEVIRRPAESLQDVPSHKVRWFAPLDFAFAALLVALARDAR